MLLGHLTSPELKQLPDWLAFKHVGHTGHHPHYCHILLDIHAHTRACGRAPLKHHCCVAVLLLALPMQSTTNEKTGYASTMAKPPASAAPGPRWSLLNASSACEYL